MKSGRYVLNGANAHVVEPGAHGSPFAVGDGRAQGPAAQARQFVINSGKQAGHVHDRLLRGVGEHRRTRGPSGRAHS